jgi:predicted nucleic acid-binding protein
MILVDTSVWIDHFRFGNGNLTAILERDLVLTHPFVIAELACGNLKHRAGTLTDLGTLPRAVMADNQEVLMYIERHSLWGFGIGCVDAHLLASALLSDASLWTPDRRLQSCAKLGNVHLYDP